MVCYRHGTSQGHDKVLNSSVEISTLFLPHLVQTNSPNGLQIIRIGSTKFLTRLKYLNDFHFDLEVVLAPIDFDLVLNGGAQ